MKGGYLYNGVVGVEGSNPFAPTNYIKNRPWAVFFMSVSSKALVQYAG